MKVFEFFKRSNRKSDEVLTKGKILMVNGQEVKVIKRVRQRHGEFNPHGKLKYNGFQSFVAQSITGQRMYIQESDVACRVRNVRTVNAQ